MVATYDLTRRLQASVTWVYNTGNAVSLPGGRFAINGVAGTAEDAVEDGPYQIASDYPARNNYRMPAYHRLDLSLVYKLRPRRGVADLTFSVYNAYNRLNPYLLTINTINTQRSAEGTPTGFKAQTTTLFPLLPSVTYNIRF